MAQKDINEALIAEAKAGNINEVRRLVEQGASINYGKIPAFMWAYFKGHTEVCKWLLSKGGNVNHDGFVEMTLPMAATVRGDVAFLSFLIDVGADVNLSLPAGGETASQSRCSKSAGNNEAPDRAGWRRESTN